MQTPDERENSNSRLDPEEYDRQEAIRLAREGQTGEATPPDLGTTTHRTKDNPDTNEDFDGTHIPSGGGSLEDRDTNDGDGNNENN